jgi:hypothetical protein
MPSSATLAGSCTSTGVTNPLIWKARLEPVGAVPVQARVDLVVDGVVEAKLGAPPYRFNWDTRQGPSGRVSLRARAIDAAGNEGAAAPIAVGVSNGGADVFGTR